MNLSTDSYIVIRSGRKGRGEEKESIFTVAVLEFSVFQNR